jgi:hypothetical protein
MSPTRPRALIRRTHAIIASAILAAALAAPAAAQIYIGPGGPVFGAPPPPAYGRPPIYDRPDYGYRPPPAFGVTCEDGADIVASQGFRNVAPRDCSGRVYRYTAYRGRAPFEVRVSSRTGEITMVRRVQ